MLPVNVDSLHVKADLASTPHRADNEFAHHILVDHRRVEDDSSVVSAKFHGDLFYGFRSRLQNLTPSADTAGEEDAPDVGM
ncbi:Uncharacterised protein [Mycobacteroides abscessus subsp. abscessus]|nr:Uncharacterised protein [Mycobacteroides abscessus subsp. abscessus]